MQEYGVFADDEGCVFIADTRSKANEYAVEQRAEDGGRYADLISVHPLCMEHRDAEQPTDACDECAEEY